ncbi:DUF29 domain-containing protein [Methylobacterium oryzisoli]|uniref:DUF29 domain-containing protein n=1 Tax=Methylobacterium oryzisoli TaxID=3385502 RepID=UPI003892C9D8
MTAATTLAAPRRAAYDDDFYTWTMQQAALLRAGDLTALDRENLAEEIECLGRGEFTRLSSFYRLVLLHMLKWEHQPNLRSRSWAVSITIHRKHAAAVIAANPGLKPRIDEALASAYEYARLEAIAETGLSAATFPETNPFTRDETMSRPYSFE